MRRRVGRRMLRDRHRNGLLRPAHVKKAAVRIAQRVVAHARDAHRAPAARAGTVGTQRHAVAAVRQHMGRLQRGGAGLHLAQQARNARSQRLQRRGRRRCLQVRHLAGHTFVQQRRHGLDVRIGHAPALRRTAQQHVGQRHDAHALVVRHEAQHRRPAFGAGLPRWREIERLDVAVATARRHRLEQSQIHGGAVRRDLRGQRGGVRCDHQFIGRRAAQRQPRHALRRVLVGQRVVAARIARFGNAPGHVAGLREGDLFAQRGLAGVVQHAVVRFVEHQGRHQVLEHRARPGTQPGQRAGRVEQPAQRRPVPHRHIALGNRQQAGQARLRRQQVVEARIELLLGDPVADVKQVPLAVIKKAEVGLPGQLLELIGQRPQLRAGLAAAVVRGRRSAGRSRRRLQGRCQRVARWQPR